MGLPLRTARTRKELDLWAEYRVAVKLFEASKASVRVAVKNYKHNNTSITEQQKSMWQDIMIMRMDKIEECLRFWMEHEV